MNKLVLVKKPNMEIIEIDNVVQLDVCNMAELGDDVSDGGWNFVSILTENNSELQKQVIRLEKVWQLMLVRKREN